MKAEHYNVVRSLPFHRYIRAARIRRALSVRKVADYIGISASNLVDIEMKRKPFKGGNGKLELLAEILQVPIEILEEKKRLTPWGREPWFAVAVDDTLRTSVRFLPAARRAFRKFEAVANDVIDKVPLTERDRENLRHALDELALVVGDGEDTK